MRPVCPPQCDICFSRVWDKFPVCLLRNGNRAERGEAPRLTGWEGNSPLFGGTGRDGDICLRYGAGREIIVECRQSSGIMRSVTGGRSSWQPDWELGLKTIPAERSESI